MGIRDTIIVEIKKFGFQARGQLLTLSHRDLPRVVAVFCVVMGYSCLGWIHILTQDQQAVYLVLLTSPGFGFVGFCLWQISVNKYSLVLST